MVGRDEELERLRELLLAAAGSSPVLALVQGEAGIGKSRLVAEFTAEARAGGALVVTAHAIDLIGAEIPFGVLSDGLRDVLRQLGPAATLEALGGESASLTHLVPMLGTAELPEADPSGRDPPERGVVFSATTTMIEQLAARRPVCLIIEDLQWADSSTCDLFGYWSRALTARAVLLVATVRTDSHVSDSFGHYLGELVRAPSCETLTLPRLSADLVREQVAALEPGLSAPALERVVRRSQGVPFYVEELVAAGRSPLATKSLHQLVLARMPDLSASARAVVDAAALGDGHLAQPLLERASSADSNAIRETIDAGVLELDPSGQSLRFCHALMREAVERALLPTQRRTLHRQWALTLEECEAGSGDAALGNRGVAARAHHWFAAGDAEQALRLSAVAARNAATLGAAHEEQALWSRILDLWPRVPLADQVAGITHGEVMVYAIGGAVGTGNWREAGRLCEKELARTTREVDPLAHDWLEVRLRESMGPRREVSDEWVVDVASRMMQAPDDVRTVDALILLAPWLPTARAGADGSGPVAADRFALNQRAAEIATRLGISRYELWTHACLADDLVTQGRPEEAIKMVETALGSAKNAVVADLWMLEVALASLHNCLGQHAEAICVAEGALTRVPDPRTLPGMYSIMIVELAAAHLAKGDWDTVLSLLDQASNLGTVGMGEGSLAAHRGLVMLCRGDLEAATASEHRVLDVIGEQAWEGSPLPVPQITFRALVAEARGEHAKARELLSGAWRLDEPQFHSEDLWMPLLAALRIEADGPRQSPRAVTSPAVHRPVVRGSEVAPRSINVVAPVIECANKLRRFGLLGQAWAAEVEAHRAQLNGSPSAALWAKAVNSWQAVGRIYDRAICQRWLIEALLDEGNRTRAQDHLDAALATTEHLRAQPLADQLLQLATRGRLRVPANLAQGRKAGADHGLTQRELEVLHLMADGLTNGGIATTLFISPKTASVHVSRILTKLLVTNRTEAAAVARRKGLLDG